MRTLGKRFAVLLTTVLFAVGLGVVTPLPASADLAAADVCQADGVFTSSGVGAVSNAGGSGGWWSLTSLALVCAGTNLLGTGIISGDGTFTPDPLVTYTADGGFSFTVGATTCSGSLQFGAMSSWAFTGQIDTTSCGSYSLGGYLVPVIPSVNPLGHSTAAFVGVLVRLA